MYTEETNKIINGINKNELYNLNVGCSYLSGMTSGGLKTEILSDSDNILDKKPVFSTYLRSSRYGKSFGWAAKDQEAFIGIEYTDIYYQKEEITETKTEEQEIESEEQKPEEKEKQTVKPQKVPTIAPKKEKSWWYRVTHLCCDQESSDVEDEISSEEVINEEKPKGIFKIFKKVQTTKTTKRVVQKPKLKRKKIKIGLDKKSFSPKDCSDTLYDVHTETETSLGTCNKLVNNIKDFFECGIFKRFFCNSNTFVKNICEDAGLQSAASLHGSAWTAGSIANKIGKLPDGKYAESERNLQFGPRTFEDGNTWSLSDKLKEEFGEEYVKNMREDYEKKIKLSNGNDNSSLNTLLKAHFGNSYQSTPSFANSFTRVSNELFVSNKSLEKKVADSSAYENSPEYKKVLESFLLRGMSLKNPDERKLFDNLLKEELKNSSEYSEEYKEVSRLISLAQKIVYEKYGIHCNNIIQVILRGSDEIETEFVKTKFPLAGAAGVYDPSNTRIVIKDFDKYNLNSCNHRKELLSTLAHEFTHATLDTNLCNPFGSANKNLPTWLNEGLATNAENPRRRSKDEIRNMTESDLYDDTKYENKNGKPNGDFYTLNNKLIKKWLESNTDQHELIKNMIQKMNDKISYEGTTTKDDYKAFFEANNGNKAKDEILTQISNASQNFKTKKLGLSDLYTLIKINNSNDTGVTTDEILQALDLSYNDHITISGFNIWLVKKALKTFEIDINEYGEMLRALNIDINSNASVTISVKSIVDYCNQHYS